MVDLFAAMSKSHAAKPTIQFIQAGKPREQLALTDNVEHKPCWTPTRSATTLADSVVQAMRDTKRVRKEANADELERETEEAPSSTPKKTRRTTGKQKPLSGSLVEQAPQQTAASKKRPSSDISSPPHEAKRLTSSTSKKSSGTGKPSLTQSSQPEQKKPSWAVEWSRNQILCRTGLKGKGQTHTIRGTDEASIKAAKEWVKKNR